MSTEIWALDILARGDSCYALPSLVAKGTVTAWDGPEPCPMVGCQCVATLLDGRALVSNGPITAACLSPTELQVLAADLLLGILHLQV